MWDRRNRQGLLSRNSYIVGERTNKLANKYNVMKVLAGNRKQEMKVIKNDQDAVFDAWPATALLMRSHSCRGAITCTPGVPHSQQKDGNCRDHVMKGEVAGKVAGEESKDYISWTSVFIKY